MDTPIMDTEHAGLTEEVARLKRVIATCRLPEVTAERDALRVSIEHLRNDLAACSDDLHEKYQADMQREGDHYREMLAGAERDNDKWMSRAIGAMLLLPDDARIGDIQESVKAHKTIMAERDALRAQLDSTRKAYETVAGTAADLRAEVAALRKALKSSPCPRPVDDIYSVEDCIKNGHCGCDNDAALADKQEPT